MAPISDLLNINDDSTDSEQQQQQQQEGGEVTVTTTSNVKEELSQQFPQINHNEVTKLMIQALTDLGYSKACEALKKESGLSIESKEINDFIGFLNHGDWDEAIDRIPYLKLISDKGGVMDNGNEEEEEVWENEYRLSIKFLILRERFLEELYSDEKSASSSSSSSSSSASSSASSSSNNNDNNTAVNLKLLDLLRKEIQSIVSSSQTLTSEHMKSLTSLLLLKSKKSPELQLSNGWHGSIETSRSALISQISQFINPNEMIPKHRLFHLLQQSLSYQKQINLYNFPSLESRDAQICLFEDLKWDRSEFPDHIVRSLSVHDNEVWFVRFNHTGSLLASCSKDGSVIVYEVGENFKVKFSLEGHEKGAMYASFSPNDQLLLSCGMHGQAFLWDMNNGKLIQKLDVVGAHCRVWSCDWLTDDEFILGSPDKVILRYDLQKNEVVQRWDGSIVNDIAVTSDKRFVICATYNKELEVYDLVTRERVNVLTIGERITSTTTSQLHNNQVLINVAPNEIQLWDWTEGVLLTKYVGHNQLKYIVRSCFGYDETVVVSGSEDGRVFIWNKEHGSLLGCFNAHGKGNTNSVDWNPDTSNRQAMFVTGGDDGKVVVWGPRFV